MFSDPTIVRLFDFERQEPFVRVYTYQHQMIQEYFISAAGCRRREDGMDIAPGDPAAIENRPENADNGVDLDPTHATINLNPNPVQRPIPAPSTGVQDPSNALLEALRRPARDTAAAGASPAVASQHAKGAAAGVPREVEAAIERQRVQLDALERRVLGATEGFTATLERVNKQLTGSLET